VQSDGYFSSDGRSQDSSWDGVRYSAARVTDFGHLVEMKIPFRSVRFKRGLVCLGDRFLPGDLGKENGRSGHTRRETKARGFLALVSLLVFTRDI